MSISLTVRLNGTNSNPFNRLGLRANPFTELGRAEWDAYERQLQKLGADPIPPEQAEAYIRETLVGFSDEFVTACVQSYKPGEMVTFEVTFPERA